VIQILLLIAFYPLEFPIRFYVFDSDIGNVFKTLSLKL
jgi:hypothetical protein